MNDMLMEEFDFSGSMGAQVAKDANKGGDFQREIMFLSLKGDEASVRQNKHQAIIRLVTEHERKEWMGANTPWSLPWITVKQHYAKTKQKPPYAREQSQWPEKVYSVCRRDKVFTAKYSDNCPVCSMGNKPSDRTWALAIEREQVVEGNQIIGMRDKTREVFDRDEKGELIVLREEGDKKEYKMKTVPAWVVLNFGWKNFFNALNGQASYRQTILDRDYVVQRSGEGPNDTNYTFIPLDPIPITGEWAQQIGVPEGTPYNLGHIVAEVEGRPVPLSEVLYPDMPDLRRIVAERTTDDYYGRWFVEGWLPEGFDPSKASNSGNSGGGVQGGVQSGYQGFQPTGGVSAQQQAQQAPQTPDSANQSQSGPPTNALEALKARVKSGQPQ